MSHTGVSLLDLADRNGGSYSVFRLGEGDWVAMYEDGGGEISGYGYYAHEAVADLETKIRARESGVTP